MPMASYEDDMDDPEYAFEYMRLNFPDLKVIIKTQSGMVDFRLGDAVISMNNDGNLVINVKDSAS